MPETPILDSPSAAQAAGATRDHGASGPRLSEEALLLSAVRAAGWLSAAAVGALAAGEPEGAAPGPPPKGGLNAADQLLLAAEALVARGALRRTLRSADGAPLPGPGHLAALLAKHDRGEALSPDEATIEVGYELRAPRG